ncbi:MAG: MFS transporter [Limnobacter sp.]|uniref:MFS transporter n=1 Tax=Limnobacter sp. TaxID=2003368 RepID=UPI0022C3330D|nr:MFS transporter [Limnobacter sp.]MCZ8016916.1 MFS transporter [Limnobacter sp.]
MNLNSTKAVSPLTVLWCGAFIMTISLGIRHSFGLFLQPMSLSNEWGREVFAFSIAMQNLVWGVAQPFVGRMADRLGSAITMLLGGALYAVGLFLMAMVESPGLLTFSAGILIGLGLSGTTFPVVFGAVSRAMPPEKRSMAMGISMALGSLGQFAFLPGGLFLINQLGWSSALTVLACFALLILLLAKPLFEKKSRSVSSEATSTIAAEKELGMWASLTQALRHRAFLMLSLGYFVCGFQILFISVHLPSYLQDSGIPASAGSTALALIGLFNILGSYLAGLWGGRMRKPMLLSGIYGLRGLLIVAFVLAPLSTWSVYLFAAGMGVLWLSTVPLTTGTVSAMFGVKNLSMLGGLVFMFHQIGAFVGGWLGGLLFDATGSYQVVWWICVALSVIAAAVNWPIEEKSAEANGPATQPA